MACVVPATPPRRFIDAGGVNVREIAATNAALRHGLRADKAMQERNRRRSLPTLQPAKNNLLQKIRITRIIDLN
jgi:hypothetical protein